MKTHQIMFQGCRLIRSVGISTASLALSLLFLSCEGLFQGLGSNEFGNSKGPNSDGLNNADLPQIDNSTQDPTAGVSPLKYEIDGKIYEVKDRRQEPAPSLSELPSDLGCEDFNQELRRCHIQINDVSGLRLNTATHFNSQATLAIDHGDQPSITVPGAGIRKIVDKTITPLAAEQLTSHIQESWAEVFISKEANPEPKFIHVWADKNGVLHGKTAERVPFALSFQRVNPSTLANVKPNDALFNNNLWALKSSNLVGQMYAEEAWRYERDCRNVTVGVIDTGVDVNHADLAENIAKRADGSIIQRNFVGAGAPNNTVTDGNGHGTHVAGTIGAVGNNQIGVAGVCWKARIAAIRVLNDEGDGVFSDVVDGINFARENNISIINLSLGGEVDQTTANMMNNAAVAYMNNGGLMVVAAGNNNRNNDNFARLMPANVNNPDATKNSVITVMSINGDGQKSDFSNFSGGRTRVHIAAPGGSGRINNQTLPIVSTTPPQSAIAQDQDAVCTANRDYCAISGTSMASPQVAGAAALYWSVYRQRTAMEVRSAILTRGTPNLNLQVSSQSHLNLFRLFQESSP